MSIMDTLTPQTIVPTGAREVSPMKKSFQLSPEMQKEMDLKRFLRKQAIEQGKQERRNRAIRSMKIRKLRDAVRTALARKERYRHEYELAVAAYEEALNA